MQTAIKPLNSSAPIWFSWDAKPNANNPIPRYICMLYFAEIQSNSKVREFYITMNGKLLYPLVMSPRYLVTDAIYNDIPYHGFDKYNISLSATANSTLPPIINAVEVFLVLPTTGAATATQDGNQLLFSENKIGHVQLASN